ncbi:hypothetical protein GE300_11605 [Rhodobacteraceae bacterium 2CG4]|uniref:Uncharacterized protein n=1 Tax=Halovulum marinum TaxID=2662447 RepID=A0A6L5Z138_9RHOB|nr:hypothetical protein [Halovulum marinum]MSU90257.1 hypothetical protein [Halovulum marinum]
MTYAQDEASPDAALFTPHHRTAGNARSADRNSECGPETTVHGFVPDCGTVMDFVAYALKRPDRQRALAEHLCALQARQQARFAALPADARQDDWVLTRHERLLRVNQASHDAALRIVQQMRQPSVAS